MRPLHESVAKETAEALIIKLSVFKQQNGKLAKIG